MSLYRTTADPEQELGCGSLRLSNSITCGRNVYITQLFFFFCSIIGLILLLLKGISTFFFSTSHCIFAGELGTVGLFLVMLMPTVQFNGNNYICFFFLLNAMGCFWLLTYQKVNVPLALYKLLNISPMFYSNTPSTLCPMKVEQNGFSQFTQVVSV